ncbi:MAG: putative beta-lysine N-acetyltransferase [Desulfobacterales bacterium]|jgi:putative beta-lysine N-acetyltransferase
MIDTIETLHRSTIQHGPLNRRIYLMKLHPDDAARIIPELSRLAREHGYGKILAKVPESLAERFRRAGYRTEARIPGFFKNGDAGLFMALFINPLREQERRPGPVTRSSAAVAAAVIDPAGNPVLDEMEECRPADAPAMSRLYREVFATYPFPIHEPAFLARAMEGHTRFFCRREADRIVALGSCEMDPDNGTVEMTDFAVAPDRRGKGLAGRLLSHMESAMRRCRMRMAYTIARSGSPAMNITFKKNGYRFAGALCNNTHIGGRIESMWVWYKPLPDSG